MNGEFDLHKLAHLFGSRVLVQFHRGSNEQCDDKSAIQCVGMLRRAQGGRSATVLTESGETVQFYVANIVSVEMVAERDPCGSDSAADNLQFDQRLHPSREGGAFQAYAEEFDFIRSIPHYDFTDLCAGSTKLLKRILVLGMGGGCDVFAAYALARLITHLQGNSTVLFGNTKVIGKKQHALLWFTQLSDCLWSAPEEVVPIVSNNTHGTCDLELGCPRGPEGSPLVFVLPGRSKDLQQHTAENVDTIVPAIASLHVDLVIGVDCGGDSISGGVDWQGCPGKGRDMQMLNCLRVCGISFLHVVLGPGCDGETEEPRMRACCAQLSAQGSLRGVFQVEPLLADMVGCCTALAPSRTPNLMLRAQSDALPSVQAPDNKSGDSVCITRGRRNTRIPREWLKHDLAINYDNAASCTRVGREGRGRRREGRGREVEVPRTNA